LDPFVQIAIIVGVTLVLAFVAKFIRQPLIISYIFSGILIGPYFLNLLETHNLLDVFSSMGIALLLFIVGLGLSPKVIKEVGKVSVVTGVGQVLFTSLFGFIIGVLLGFDFFAAIFIAIALTFSSTIIIMKLLTDKGDTETLYGKISIGFLIVQDLIVMLLLLFITAIPPGGTIGVEFFQTLAQGILLVILILFVGFKILPKLMDFISTSQELLLVFSLGWCFVLAASFEITGFSMEIGALLAGFVLAASPYRFEINSKLRVLRDFFLVLFFIFLGSQLVFGNITNLIIPILVFSAFILIGNPLIVVILMGLMGYTKKTGFLAGLTVAQISEFSIILITILLNRGYFEYVAELSTFYTAHDLLLLVTTVGLITITGSSYLILYSEKIYPFFENFLTIFERKKSRKEKIKDIKKYVEDYDCVLFGCNRIGHDILRALNKTGAKYFVVDYDPYKIKGFEKRKIETVYGDSSDSNFLDELPLNKIKMIVSTVPELSTNILILEKLRKVNSKVVSILVSYQAEDAIRLYDEGASYVIIPHFLGGHYTANMIETHGLNLDKFLKEKLNHIKYLEQRKRDAPEHFNYEIK
jgi:Kef-type K+ transport system membrane component KefB